MIMVTGKACSKIHLGITGKSRKKFNRAGSTANECSDFWLVGLGQNIYSNGLEKSGLSAYEDGDLLGLSCWYNRKGKEIDTPITAIEALWVSTIPFYGANVYSKAFSPLILMHTFLAVRAIFFTQCLYSKNSFLRVEPGIQKERKHHLPREAPLMDFDGERIVVREDWLEEEAKKRGLPFLGAMLLPEWLSKK